MTKQKKQDELNKIEKDYPEPSKNDIVGAVVGDLFR